MDVQTLTVGGRDFVILPKKRYEQMRAKLEALAAEEKGDVAEAARRSREHSIPLSEVRKRLGR